MSIVKQKLDSIRAAAVLCAAALLAFCWQASAADKLTVYMPWLAQADHGGYYQAKATGLYEKAGLDVTIEPGRPGVNSYQLLVAGSADIIVGLDPAVLAARAQGLPLVAVGAAFQFDLRGLMTHEDVSSIEELKGRPIIMDGGARLTIWPWLRAKYGLTDDQLRPSAASLQPFFADQTMAMQSVLTSEPFVAQQQGVKVKFFPYAEAGYPIYNSTMITTEATIAERPDVVARFVKASLEGWRDYLQDPAAGNTLIKTVNPKMDDGLLGFAVAKLKEIKVVNGGDAATRGIGIMTAERWKKTYDVLVEAGILDAKVDWQKAFTDQFVKDLKITF